MPRILKRPRSKADLAEIWGYIAEDSEDRADAFIDVIDKKLSMLAENSGLSLSAHPHMLRHACGFALKSPGTRNLQQMPD